MIEALIAVHTSGGAEMQTLSSSVNVLSRRHDEDDQQHRAHAAAQTSAHRADHLHPAVDKIASRVSVKDTTLAKTNAENGIVAPDGKCGPYADAASGNKADGAPLCKK